MIRTCSITSPGRTGTSPRPSSAGRAAGRTRGYPPRSVRTGQVRPSRQAGDLNRGGDAARGADAEPAEPVVAPGQHGAAGPHREHQSAVGRDLGGPAAGPDGVHRPGHRGGGGRAAELPGGGLNVHPAASSSSNAWRAPVAASCRGYPGAKYPGSGSERSPSGIERAWRKKVEQVVLGIVKICLVREEYSSVRTAVLNFRAPAQGGVVCGSGGVVETTIGVKRQAVELGRSVGIPVKGQLGGAIEAVAVVVGPAGQRLHRLVEVLEDLTSMLKRAGLVLTGPSLLFPCSFSLPGLVITMIRPPLGEEATGESPDHSYASRGQRQPEGCTAHGLHDAALDCAEARTSRKA